MVWKTSSSAFRRRSQRRRFSTGDARLLRYLAYLCIKYEIDPMDFFGGIQEALEEGEAKCGCLTILFRVRDREKSTFLITRNSEVVTQFNVSKRLLGEENPIEAFFHEIKSLVKMKEVSKVSCIKDLKVGMRKVKVTGEILEIEKPRRIITRFGLPSIVANAVIGDDSGTIILPLWNKQINRFFVGDRINVSRAKVVRFHGNLQLWVGRTGQLTHVEEDSSAKKK